jgi:type IV secretion system protein VirD4
MLGHQPALGAPWISLGGVAIYAPWRLFAWWIAFDAQAPDVFRRAGLLALAGGIAPALIAIGGAAWRSRTETVKTTYGSARWAALADVRDAGLLAQRGVVLGLFDDAYLRHDGPEHILAVAPTRSGKGVGLVVPTNGSAGSRAALVRPPEGSSLPPSVGSLMVGRLQHLLRRTS